MLPQNPTPQDPLPFKNCAEFVDYLAGLAADALKNVTDPRMTMRGNAAFVAGNLGVAMMSTTFFGYERHINNKAEGFKDKLVAGGQGAGVYGHILGTSRRLS